MLPRRVTYLRWADKSHLIINDHVSNDSSQPIRLGNHISVQRCNELGFTSFQIKHEVGTTSKISSFEMMRDSLDLDTGMVVNIGVFEREIIDSLFQFGIFTIVKDDNAETVLGILEFLLVICFRGNGRDLEPTSPAAAARVVSITTSTSSPQHVMKASTVGTVSPRRRIFGRERPRMDNIWYI